MTSKTFALVAAPTGFLAYGVIRLIGRAGGHYGPGPSWELAHAADLIGLVLFVPLVLCLRQELRDSRGADLVGSITLVGVGASIVQIGVDIVSGLVSANKAEMSTFTGHFSSFPGAELVFYQVGPQLMYVGLLVLSIMLARVHALPWWSPAVVLVSVLLPLVSLDLLPISAMGLLAALTPLTARLLRRQAAVVGRTTSRVSVRD
ncbi:MAG TPA: hypothetical protein VHW44_27110 [Pseudonocardiaceae bacterium]|jgi:hypothetical protein|nr:hypothetical protein [Pseudonocardiaceae bacterium]